MKYVKSSILFILIFLAADLSLKAQDFWEQLYFPDSADIVSIAVSDEQVIYLGTGSGIYRSDDGGNNWTLLWLENRIVYSIAINDNNDIYAGTSQAAQVGGLFRSSDNGETWSSILPDIGAYGNILKILCLGDTIYASLWMDDSSLIRSTDNGQTWSIVFLTGSSSEYISDIIKSNSGDIYISLKGYFENKGGVYKSVDGGDNWDFIGLFNYMVSSLALNDADDLFAGSWGGLADTTSSGLYVLRNGEEQWETLLANPQVSDIIINTENEIYFSSSWPDGVVRSLDNGESFELINEGLPDGIMRDMFLDNLGFLYVTNLICVAKSINPTVSISEENSISTVNPWIIYPNPVNNLLYIRTLDNIQINNIKRIKIYNSNGELLISENTLSIDNFNINVNKLPSGLYFIEINGENITTIAKIIIK